MNWVLLPFRVHYDMQLGCGERIQDWKVGYLVDGAFPFFQVLLSPFHYRSSINHFLHLYLLLVIQAFPDNSTLHPLLNSYNLVVV